MKILYSVQATGNGHISRATQLLPYLRRFGKVDIFLSGANSQLQNDLPVRYRSRGMSLFYNTNGGLQYKKIARQLNPARLLKEIKELPVEKYDVVINDFECITSLACAYKKIPSVNFGHQAAFQSPLAPRPANREVMGEFLLKHYARASQYLGLHFRAYDDFIFEPIIKKEILQAEPANAGHITVYLSAFNDKVLTKVFNDLKAFRFEIFSREVKQVVTVENVKLIPVQQRLFNESMIRSYGVITGAGFETPAEVMHLGKKLMVIPIKGQYEQYCNAAALAELGIKVVNHIDAHFSNVFLDWIGGENIPSIRYENNIPEILGYLMDNYPSKGVSLDLLHPDLMLG
ncbi:glycosyltransferase family protein [Flavihumibacter stibioxidans]|uniref:Glycosyl transferase n=1 Tax=Flavihumibacter stibioxidans TaxID=1834163 RepID=A0ABR7M9Z4_9BACT|nr:glycosyltransferase family protein [Flavihumibacter stibioxidans]MBC6491863.1 glycosyl transferase [Flavihumibacter stibioxidans]